MRKNTFYSLLLIQYVLAIVLAARTLDVPGIYYDEVLFINAAFGGVTDSFVHARLFGIPVLLMPYLGALKAWLYYPLFFVFSVNPWSIRIPALIIGCTGGVFLVLAVSRLFGRRAGLFCALLTLFDPSLLMHSRLDWGPTAFMFLFRGILFYGMARWWSDGRPAGLWLAIIAGALGAFDKLNFIWIIVSAWLGLYITGRSKLVAYYSENRSTALIQIGLLSGMMIVLVVRSVFVTVSMDLPSGWSGERLNAASSLIYLTMIGGGALEFICGNGRAPGAWMVPAYLFAATTGVIMMIVNRRALAWRPWIFMFTATSLLATFFVITPSATGPHHAAVVASLPAALLSPLLAGRTPHGYRPMARRVLMICSHASALALSLLMLYTVNFAIFSFGNPVNPNWDPGHYRLRELVKRYDGAWFRTGDWGMGTQLIGFSKGKARVNDNWPEFIASYGRGHDLFFTLDGSPVVLLLRAPGKENNRLANTNAMATLDLSGRPYHEDEPIRDIRGESLIRIIHVKGGDPSGLYPALDGSMLR